MQTGVATATQGPATMFTTTDSVGSTAEAKLLSYLDASPSTSKVLLRFILTFYSTHFFPPDKKFVII